MTSLYSSYRVIWTDSLNVGEINLVKKLLKQEPRRWRRIIAESGHRGGQNQLRMLYGPENRLEAAFGYSGFLNIAVECCPVSFLIG